MEQSGIQEILHALKLHSAHIDEELNVMATNLENRIDKVKIDLENRMDNLKTDLENRMDEKFDRMEKRFDRLESKLNGFRVELTETQETVDYLTIKNAQHEKKLRPQIGQ